MGALGGDIEGRRLIFGPVTDLVSLEVVHSATVVPTTDTAEW